MSAIAPGSIKLYDFSKDAVKISYSQPQLLMLNNRNNAPQLAKVQQDHLAAVFMGKNSFCPKLEKQGNNYHPLDDDSCVFMHGLWRFFYGSIALPNDIIPKIPGTAVDGTGDGAGGIISFRHPDLLRNERYKAFIETCEIPVEVVQ